MKTLDLVCPHCRHEWRLPVECENRVCPECYRKARNRAARSTGPGTSHEHALVLCARKDAFGREMRPRV